MTAAKYNTTKPQKLIRNKFETKWIDMPNGMENDQNSGVIYGTYVFGKMELYTFLKEVPRNIGIVEDILQMCRKQ